MANPLVLKQAIMKLLGSGNEGKLPVPQKQIGPGPDPFYGHTPESAQGLAEEIPIEEVLSINPTFSPSQKQALKFKTEPELRKKEQGELFRSRPGEKKKTVDIIEDRAKLREATTEQRSRGGPLDGGYGKGGLAADNNDLSQQVIDEIDLSQTQRNRVKTQQANPNVKLPGPQKIRDASQLETLGRSKDEQRMLDEAARVKFYADQATAKGANNVPERVASSAKQFNETENLNTDIQDMYSRLDEMFPGFKKNTQNGDEFFELNPVTGKPIPGAKLQGGKNASMASRLVDTRKKMQNLAERAREATNPDALMQIKKQLDEIDTEFFGTNTNQAQRQAGTTINPESNIKAVSFINEDGDVINDFKSNIRTDDGVEFSGRSDVNQLGPKTTGNLENLLRKRQSGFKQSQTRLPPPVEGTLSTQDTLLNILRDIQQGKLGPIGQ